MTRRMKQFGIAALVLTLMPAMAAAQDNPAQPPAQQPPAQGQKPDPGPDPTPGERLDEAIETATTGPWEAGVYVMPMLGTGFGADLDGGSLLLGAAVGYDTGGPFSMEGELGFVNGANQAPGFFDLDFDTRIVSFMANALWHFGTEEGFRPYASLGLGVQNADVDVEDPVFGDEVLDAESTEFAWSWGGGIRTSIANRTDFRWDLRYMTGDEAVPSFWRTYAGVTFGLGPR